MAHCTHIQFTALTAQGNAVKHAKAVEIHMYYYIQTAWQRKTLHYYALTTRLGKTFQI
jgi:hypothetical protein